MAALLLLSDASPAFAAESVTDYSDADSAAQAELVTSDAPATDDSGVTADSAQASPVAPDAPATDDSGVTANPAQASSVTPDAPAPDDDSGDTANPAQTDAVAPDAPAPDDDSGDAADNPEKQKSGVSSRKYADIVSAVELLSPPSTEGSSSAADYDKDNGSSAQGQSPTRPPETSAADSEETATLLGRILQIQQAENLPTYVSSPVLKVEPKPKKKLPPLSPWPERIHENPDADNPFTDVSKNNYFFKSVLWAVTNEITNGTSKTEFSPGQTCRHKHILAFLWRICGEREYDEDEIEPKYYETKSPFRDVEANLDQIWIHVALWSEENGLRSADKDGKFNGDQSCTRAEAMRYIWILSGRPAPRETAPFRDLSQLGEEYVTAISWAVEQGITNGKTETTFSPGDFCTRANIVTFLYRAWQAAQSSKA